ncbi:MAG: SAF domain-containing protein, partial [Planctomycetota bacterium]
AAGACVVEKHLTHDRGAAGPDHAASVEPEGLAAYVAGVRRAAAMMGPRAKRCTAIERDVRRVSRQSVCVTRDLPAGHTLTAEDLTVKRPGTGLPASVLGELVGRRLARAVAGNRLLRDEDLAGGGK